MITIYYINIKIIFILYCSVIIIDYIEINMCCRMSCGYIKDTDKTICNIYNMASRCVLDLNPEIVARGEVEGWRADIADTHQEAMLYIIFSIPNMYINATWHLWLYAPFSVYLQLFSIYNLTAHAQTDTIYYEYHYRSYISPVVSLFW